MFFRRKNYKVKFSKFAERHFLKEFKKKFKGRQWEVTETAIIQSLENVVGLSLTDKLDLIKATEERMLLKYDFKIAKTNESAKTSGNRLIAVLDEKAGSIEICLIYNKNHCPTGKETIWWKGLLKENFKAYKEEFCL